MTVQVRHAEIPAADARWVELFALDDSRVIGACTLRYWDGEVPQLSDFTVDEASRNKGVGSALLKRAVDLCREAGKRAVNLVVEKANDAAERLYVREGFRTYHASDTQRWLALPLS